MHAGDLDYWMWNFAADFAVTCSFSPALDPELASSPRLQLCTDSSRQSRSDEALQPRRQHNSLTMRNVNVLHVNVLLTFF